MLVIIAEIFSSTFRAAILDILIFLADIEVPTFYNITIDYFHTLLIADEAALFPA